MIKSGGLTADDRERFEKRGSNGGQDTQPRCDLEQ